MSDMIEFEILEDSTISIKTSVISEKNHASADDLIELIEKEMGSVRKTEHLKHTHKHYHHVHQKQIA